MSKKFKSLLEFLEGPVWNTPIMTFIEMKSAVFTEDNENESEYMEIYNDYKRLVDTMLGTYLDDMNLTPEQFEEECKQATDSKVMTVFRQNLFEQVWAAENFEIFKRMMLQKNIELELQALAVLQETLGLDLGHTSPEEDEILQKVLKQSAEEHKSHMKRLEKYDKEYENALKDTMKEAKRLDIEYRRSKEMLEQAIMSSVTENVSSDAASQPGKTKKQVPSTKSAPSKGPRAGVKAELPAVKNFEKRKSLPAMESTAVGDPKLASLEEKRTTLNRNKSDVVSQKSLPVDPETLLLRKKYLCEQRDKLVEQKKLEREKNLRQYDASKRPKSAKAARNYLDQKMDSSSSNEIDQKTLQMRRLLAQRFKEELFNQK